MLFKVDENLSPQIAELLRPRGHDALTVADQRMRGAPDDHLAAVCQAEGRVLLALDAGFADLTRSTPEARPGVVVLRLQNHGRAAVRGVIERLCDVLSRQEVRGALWIVDEVSIRIRNPS